MNSRRFTTILTTLGLLGVLPILAGCGASDSSAKTSSTAQAQSTVLPSPVSLKVNVKTFMFQPSPLKVVSGARVTWTNADEILHTITSGTPDGPTGLFNSPLDGPSTSFTFTFEKPGAYLYFCSRHNGMRGEVEVT